MLRGLFFLYFLLSMAVGGYTQSVSGAVTSKDTVKLANTNWRAISIKDHSLGKDSNVTIHFGPLTNGKGSVSGDSGCNRFTGQYYLSYSQEGATVLGFSQLASTRMLCSSKERNDIETAFLQTIPFVQTFFFLEGKLSLQTVDGKIVIVLLPAAEKGKTA